MAYAMWGLRASPELDAFDVGAKIVAAQAAAIQANGYWAEFNPAPYWGEKPLKAREGIELFCRSRAETPNCLTAYRANREAIEIELREQNIYVQRYRSLQNYPYFEEALTPTLSVSDISWASIIRLVDLVDAQIALDTVDPSRRATALSALLTEVSRWKKVGRETDLLATKMMSANLLRKQVRLASELLSAHPEIAFEHGDLIAKITEPLGMDDTHMKRTFNGEFRLAAVTIQNLKSHPNTKDGLKKFFLVVCLKPDATANMRYAHLEAVGDFYSKTGVEISAGATAFEASTIPFNELDPRTWLYNPYGKVLAGVAVPKYSSYAYRLHDLAGYSRLVALQRQLALNRTPPEKIAEFIAAADANLTDPYTGKAMAYDPAKQTISFATRGKTDAGEGVVKINAATH